MLNKQHQLLGTLVGHKRAYLQLHHQCLELVLAPRLTGRKHIPRSSCSTGSRKEERLRNSQCKAVRHAMLCCAGVSTSALHHVTFTAACALLQVI
jgi:hypothetical protein